MNWVFRLDSGRGSENIEKYSAAAAAGATRRPPK